MTRCGWRCACWSCPVCSARLAEELAERAALRRGAGHRPAAVRTGAAARGGAGRKATRSSQPTTATLQHRGRFPAGDLRAAFRFTNVPGGTRQDHNRAARFEKASCRSRSAVTRRSLNSLIRSFPARAHRRGGTKSKFEPLHARDDAGAGQVVRWTCPVLTEEEGGKINARRCARSLRWHFSRSG